MVEVVARARAAPTARGTCRAAAAAASEAVGDAQLPRVSLWRQGLEVERLRRIATVLNGWPGGETMAHIPTTVRPQLAEIMAELISAMVAGCEASGLMLKSLPKLVLHGAAARKVGPGGSPGLVRRRLVMLLRNQLDELLTTVQLERAAPGRVMRRRTVEGSEKREPYGRVKTLARAGAYSKAVRALDGAEIAHYNEVDALKWARQLVPDAPPDAAATLGARPMEEEERSKMDGLKTCAEEILGEEPQAGGSEDVLDRDGSDLDDDGAIRRVAQPKKRRWPSTNAYAKGVRFAALSAPGPSGLRPEHLLELAQTRSLRSRRSFEQAMSGFVASAVSGRLPVTSSWWITDSALTFIRKPGATLEDAPRPLRVGEVLRRFVGKRIAAAEKAHMRELFARERQFGVACPGGAEVLAHHRMVTCGGEPGSWMGDWDLDIKNCYGSLYWSAIDAAVEVHLPGALPWTRWLHNRSTRVVLPGGGVHETQRGAEQGDPLGGAYAAAALVEACRRARVGAEETKKGMIDGNWTGRGIMDMIAEMWGRIGADAHPTAARVIDGWRRRAEDRTGDQFGPWDAGVAERGAVRAEESLRMLDVWYVDDAFVREKCVDVELWLAAFDAQGAMAGFERSARKSIYRGHPGQPTPPYTASTYVTRGRDEETKYLGVSIGKESEQFVARVDEVRALHDKLHRLEDPAVELVLTRQCAEVGKVMYLMRAVAPAVVAGGGRGLSDGALAAMDRVTREAVSRIARRDVTPEAAEQASWGVKAGGLGLRPASRVALPAYLASLIEAAPFVHWLAEAARERGITISRPIEAVVAVVREECLRIQATDELREEIDETLDEAMDSARRTAAQVLGTEDGRAGQNGRAGAGVRVGGSMEPPPAARAALEGPDHPDPPDPGGGGGGGGGGRGRGAGGGSAGGRRGAWRCRGGGGGGRGGPSSVAAAGSEVGERGGAEESKKDGGGGSRKGRLQHKILTAMEGQMVRATIEGLQGSAEETDKTRYCRLNELSSKHTNHSWMWAINPAHGLVLLPDHFLTALRLRLGIRVASYAGLVGCGECGRMCTAEQLGDHALLCGKGQRTISHDRACDLVADLAKLSDSTTRTEVAWRSAVDAMIDGQHTELRPADILTSASPFGGVGLAALNGSDHITALGAEASDGDRSVGLLSSVEGGEVSGRGDGGGVGLQAILARQLRASR